MVQSRRIAINGGFRRLAIRRGDLGPPVTQGLEQSLLISTAMSGSTVFDERSGLGTARDMQPGRAYDFDGVDDYISTGVASSELVNFTICGWATREASAAGPNAFRAVTIARSTTSSRLTLTYGSDQIQLFYYDGASNTYDTGINPASGTFFHWAVTYDGSDLKLYINNSLETTISTSLDAPDSTAFRIGTNPAASDNFWDGKQFDVRAYNTALTADNINHIYNFGATGVDPGTSSLLLQYKCDDTDSSTAYDSSGNGNDGTKTGITPATFHYEGADVPYSFQNEVGYSDTNIPRDESDTGNDVLGNPLDYVGEAPANASLVNSNCGTFDGTNDYVNTNLNPDYSDVRLRYRAQYKTSSTSVVLSQGGFSVAIGGWLINVNGNVAKKLTTGNSAVAVSNESLGDGEWHEVDIEFTVNNDSNPATIHSAFVDGVDITANYTESPGAGSWNYDTTTDLVISGRDGGSEGPYFDGNIAYVNLYNVTADEDVFSYVFSEGGGITIYDITGNGNHGIANNITESSFWGTLQNVHHHNILNGYEWAGELKTGDRIDLGSQSAPATNATFSFFMRTNNSSAFTPFAYGRTRLTKSGSVWQWYPDSFGVNQNFTISTAVDDGKWVHITVVQSGTEAYYYVNGSLEASDLSTPALSTTAANSYLGSSGSSSWLIGSIRDFRVYDVALEASDVAIIATGGDVSATPVHRLAIDSETATTTIPASQGDDGTLNGITAADFWLRVPANAGTSIITGSAADHLGGAFHNGAETEIDFTGGVAAPGTASWETAWGFHDARTNPLFNRELTSSSVVVRADRFLAYSATLSGNDLTKTQSYVATKEI